MILSHRLLISEPRICQESGINLSRPHVAQVKRISDSWPCTLRGHYLTVTVSSLKIAKNHHLIWPSHCFTPSLGVLGSPLLSLSSSRFILVFDTVAEHQRHDSGQCSCATSFCSVLSSHDDSTTTRPTNQITSSSGEKERNHWSSKLQEETDIKMFINNPKFNPRLSSPTSFDGVNHHMLNGQKRCSLFCQSQTIRSLFQVFRQSLVTKTSSQRRSSLKEFSQSSLKRSGTRRQSLRKSHQEFGS